MFLQHKNQHNYGQKWRKCAPCEAIVSQKILHSLKEKKKKTLTTAGVWSLDECWTPGWENAGSGCICITGWDAITAPGTGPRKLGLMWILCDLGGAAVGTPSRCWGMNIETGGGSDSWWERSKGCWGCTGAGVPGGTWPGRRGEPPMCWRGTILNPPCWLGKRMRLPCCCGSLSKGRGSVWLPGNVSPNGRPRFTPSWQPCGGPKRNLASLRKPRGCPNWGSWPWRRPGRDCWGWGCKRMPNGCRWVCWNGPRKSMPLCPSCLW